MTQRSMPVGQTRTIVIWGDDITVEGWESDRVQANTDSRAGLQIERRQVTAIRRERARAAIGEHVLFDVSFDNPFNRSNHLTKNLQGEVIVVTVRGDGQVRVPLNSELIVYAGYDGEVRHLQGRVTATSGRDLKLQDVQVLVHAAAGRDLDVDCATLEGSDLKFSSGRDLRFYVHDLTDAKVNITDRGNYWEALLGDGRITLKLRAGGDVTLVTDQEVQALPPYYVLGNIEKPAATPPN